jgi:hypothetical protein
VPYTNTVAGVGSVTGFPVDYYVFNVSTGAVRAQLEVLAPNGNVTLVARKGLPLPNLANTTLVSANGGTSDELIVLLDTSAPVALSPGDWYLAVINTGAAPVNYAVVATEFTSRGTNIYIRKITLDSNGVCLTWTNTLVGVNYYVQGVTNLGDAWIPVSTTIKATGSEIIWCTPLPTPYRFFRIAEGLSPLSVQAPVAFFSPAWTSGRMVLQWTASPNRRFSVEWTDSLSPAAWQPVPGVITSATTAYTFTDNGSLTAPLNANRFYRVRQVP